MAENIDKNTDDKKQNLPSSSSGAGVPIVGRFARYNSAFWAIILPFLSVRYVFKGLHLLNPSPPPPRRPTIGTWAITNLYTLLYGSALFGVIGYYTNRTYADIKHLYSEALGYEFGKKPQDIGVMDLVRSKNEIVKKTMRDFSHRTFYRSLAALTFFIPWGSFTKKMNGQARWTQTDQLDNIGADFGTGIMGAYLFGDGFLRKQTLFEKEQVTMDEKINHVDGQIYKTVGFDDIAAMLDLHRKHINPSYHPPALASPEGKSEALLAARIADLLNQTYNNAPKTGHADFTIGKFNYLLGFGLLDSYPASLGFVELANNSTDMTSVNKAAEAIKGGQSPQAVFRQQGAHTEATIPMLGMESTTTKFTSLLQPAKDRIPTAPRTAQDFASLVADPGSPSVH